MVSNVFTGYLPIALHIKVAVLALVFGASLLFIAGASQSQVLHDAAHDARHSFGWVCH